MRLYIPEIGDKLKLTEDWCFELHAEGRNVALAALYGYYHSYHAGWVDEKLVPQMEGNDYDVKYPERQGYPHQTYDEYQALCKQAEDECPEYVKYQKDYREWSKKCEAFGKPTINIVLPVGTIIKVDRIYIRKGASDYSSVTFYAIGLGSVVVTPTYSWEKKKKKSALRFWVKLADCNNIFFEKEV